MKLLKLAGINDVFGLDIGTSAIRGVQVKGVNAPYGLYRYGSVQIDPKISESSSANDKTVFKDIMSKFLEQSQFSTKHVVVGIPSNKTFITVVEFPKLPEAELHKTIEYQAENHIPMSADEVKIDWSVLGDVPGTDDKVEVLIASVTNEFTEKRLELIESLGLNVVAIEPDPIALMRALTPVSYLNSAIVLDIGERATDLVALTQGTPRLVRSIPTGGQAFIKAAMQNLNIDEKQANQFVYKFGLNRTSLEGQVHKALSPTADNLCAEIVKSIKFFVGRYQNLQLEKIIVSGRASSLPGFPLYVANNTGFPVEIGNAWQNVSYSPQLHNDLISISSRFAVASGLAQRRDQ